MMLLRIVALFHKRIMSRLVLSASEAETSRLDLESLLASSTSLASASDDVASALWSPQDIQQIISRAKSIQDRVHTLREPLISSGLLPSSSTEQSSEGSPQPATTNKDIEWFKMCFE